MTTLIDPRFKKTGFRSQTSYEEAVNMIQNLLAVQLKNQIETNVNETHSNNYIAKSSKSTGIFNFMENSSHFSTINIDNIILIRNFLSCPNINLSEEPLHYLKTRHPEIFQIALKYLCISGSSVLVERLFSATGYIISDSSPFGAPWIRTRLLFLLKKVSSPPKMQKLSDSNRRAQ